MSDARNEASSLRRPPAKYAPPSRQHSTAGPYSPVLEVDARTLVVISGQAAVDLDGNVASQDIAEQSTLTLENCRNQLAAAGCTFADVFKVNVYMKDLAQWAEFNSVYAGIMEEPLPVRTAIQAGLLEGLLVEVEMWAAKHRGADAGP